LIILKAINLVFILSFYFHTSILQYTNVLIQRNFIFQSLITYLEIKTCHTNFNFLSSQPKKFVIYFTYKDIHDEPEHS